jgi:hypothetical protein
MIKVKKNCYLINQIKIVFMNLFIIIQENKRYLNIYTIYLNNYR